MCWFISWCSSELSLLVDVVAKQGRMHPSLAVVPLSPIFLPGGLLDGWNEDLTEAGFFIVCLAALDFGVARFVLWPLCSTC
jgi:hypothetical protein